MNNRKEIVTATMMMERSGTLWGWACLIMYVLLVRMNGIANVTREFLFFPLHGLTKQASHVRANIMSVYSGLTTVGIEPEVPWVITIGCWIWFIVTLNTPPCSWLPLFIQLTMHCFVLFSVKVTLWRLKDSRFLWFVSTKWHPTEVFMFCDWLTLV